MNEENIDINLVLNVSEKLKTNILKLKEVYSKTKEVTFDILKVRTDNKIRQPINLKYSLWVLFKFELNMDKYAQYINTILDERDNTLRGYSLFGNRTVEDEEYLLEIENFLNQIDIALNYLSKVLSFELPNVLVRYEKCSIRNVDYSISDALIRIEAFVEAILTTFKTNNS